MKVRVGIGLTVMSLLGVQAREALARIEPLARFIDRAMLVGVLLLAAGTIVGGAWARSTWGQFWRWDGSSGASSGEERSHQGHGVSHRRARVAWRCES